VGRFRGIYEVETVSVGEGSVRGRYHVLLHVLLHVRLHDEGGGARRGRNRIARRLMGVYGPTGKVLAERL